MPAPSAHSHNPREGLVPLPQLSPYGDLTG
jgi:hypothetical protein